MAIGNTYVAYCFDSAVAYLGNHIEAELDKVEGKSAKQIRARREAKLRALLLDRPTARFADPAVLFGGKKKVSG